MNVRRGAVDRVLALLVDRAARSERTAAVSPATFAMTIRKLSVMIIHHQGFSEFDGNARYHMSVSESTKAYTGMCVILGASAGLFFIHLDRVLADGGDVQLLLTGTLIPMLGAVGVFTGGIWLWRRGMNGEHILRVAGWCVLGAVALAVETGLMTYYQRTEGVTITHQFYMFVNAVSGGAVIGFIIGVYDSRGRAAREESARLSRQLSVLNRVLRHDIRNSANVIQGYAELLTDDPEDPTKQARKIRDQSTTLVEMGEQARDIERILQEDAPDTETVDIVSLIETSREHITREYPHAVVDVSLPEELVISAHPLVDSALGNVIENAVEHNDKATPRVTIESADVLRDGTEFVEIRIADNGPGIPASEREILERGYETQLEHTNGLGLWLVYWIVMRSGGEIRFEENDPEGSVVCLQFERARVAPAPGSALSSPVTDATMS